MIALYVVIIDKSAAPLNHRNRKKHLEMRVVPIFGFPYLGWSAPEKKKA